jgi:hypothetical protein
MVMGGLSHAIRRGELALSFLTSAVAVHYQVILDVVWTFTLADSVLHNWELSKS